MADPDDERRRLNGTLGANIRLLGLDEQGQRDMTAAARAAREAKYLERLKDEVDPNGEMTDERRTEQATRLLHAKRAAAQLARQRRERNREFGEQALDELTALGALTA